MKLLTFQKPNKFYLFFLAYFVTIFLRQLLNDHIMGTFGHKYEYFFRMYSYVLSHILSFIPYFISKCLSKRKVQTYENNPNINYIYNSVPKKYKCKNLMKPILIVSLFGFSSEAILYLYYAFSIRPVHNTYSLGIYSILNTVLIYIVSYYVLKTYFYKHHYLSLSINSLCFLISLIVDIIQLVHYKIDDYSYYIFIIVRIIRLILRCFLYCLSKKAFDSSLLTPYSIIAFRSIYETLFLGAFSIPFTFLSINDYHIGEEGIIFSGFEKYLKGTKLLYSILLLIDNYLNDLFIMLIIDKFSPSHLTLAITLESFSEIGYKIIRDNITKNYVSWGDYVNFGVYFILFIGTMIHNEIFIINKWELNKKTKLFLNNEFNIENKDIEDIINNFEEEEENDDDEKSKDKLEMCSTKKSQM